MKHAPLLLQGRTYVRPIGTLVALVLFTGAWTSRSGTPTVAVTERTLRSAVVEQPVGPPKTAGSADPWLGSGEKKCIEDGFKDHVHVGTVASHATITHPTFKFKVSSLKTAVANAGNCTPTGTYRTAVVVHYGLDGSNQLDLAFEVRCLNWDEANRTYAYTSTGSYYKISNEQLTEVPNGLSTWKGNQGKKYADNVVIQRSTGSGWELFKAGHDVVSTVFPYELHLKDMITHNGLADGDFIHVMPGAEPTEWQHDGAGGINEYNYRQGLVWIPDPTKVSLDGIDHGHGKEFMNKAADLGSACPPNCVVVTFPTKGLHRRPNC